MNLFIYLLVSTVKIILGIEYVLFMLRAVYSWIFMGEESPIGNFLYMATEPFIVTVRKVLSFFGDLQNFPLDIAFWITSVLIIFAPSMLPTVYL